jgi:hypothetical protein
MSLSEVTEITVPRRCIETIHRHLRTVGAQGYEGLGLLVGRQVDQRFDVTEAVIPAQRHIRTADGVCVSLDAEELHRLNVWLWQNKVKLLAQIHSHPGRAYHSDTDDAYAIATSIGCLSLVIPNFAIAPFELGTTASYRLDDEGKWREIRRTDISRLITIVE